LKNDVAKNSLWRSAAVNIPRNSSSTITHNRGNAPMQMPPYNRSHGSIGQSNHDNHHSFGGNGDKDSSGGKLNWGHLKDAKGDR